MNISKIGKSFTFSIFLLLVLLLAFGMNLLFPVHAQGPSTVPGQIFSSQLFPAANLTNVGGIVTNTGTTVMAVTPAAVFCNGAEQSLAPVTLTLNINTTYMIVYNCPLNIVYAKTGVVGPGSGTGTAGQPSILLSAVPNVEIPLATVVCGAATCPTITDNRPTTAFLVGGVMGNHMFTPLANSDVSFSATLAANTVTKTWTQAYQVAPIVVCSDVTATGSTIRTAPTTTNVVITTVGGATDVMNCIVIANPN
jgi:hypothetical protein